MAGTDAPTREGPSRLTDQAMGATGTWAGSQGLWQLRWLSPFR
jgi:hypothetical protein